MSTPTSDHQDSNGHLQQESGTAVLSPEQTQGPGEEPQSIVQPEVKVQAQQKTNLYPFVFSNLHEGSHDPTLDKTVKWLINCDDNFIIYIDEDLYVEWTMNDNAMLGVEAGPFLNRVGQLEAVDTSYLSATRITSFKRMIAEGVARLFEKNYEAAKDALDLAEAWINARNIEVARRWYLAGSGAVALLSFLLVLALGYWNQQLWTLPYFDLAVGTAFGGLGAWLSVIQRSRSAGLDVAAGPALHYLEGAFRIMAGSLGALLVAMAIRAGLFIQADRLSVTLVICMVAGVSERLVPSFIEQMESRSSAPVSS